MFSVPLIKGGEDYFSQDRQTVKDYKGNGLLEVSAAIPLQVGRWAVPNTRTKGFDNLKNLDMKEILEIFYRAGEIFAHRPVQMGRDKITPSEHCELVALSTGLPVSSVEKSMKDLEMSMKYAEVPLKAQTHGGRLDVYDTWRTCAPKGRNLGVVLPMNHPSVNVLWLFAQALKYPIVARPSEDDVLTPYRLIRSLYDAGLPEHAAYFMPGNHDLVPQMLPPNGCDMGMIFGTRELIERFDSVRVKGYGPGESKCYDDFCDEKTLKTHIRGMMADGGRGCINTSAVLTKTGKSREVADEIAKRVAQYEAMDPLNPVAVVPAIKNARMAKAINEYIEGLLQDGAEDITSNYRTTPRLVEHGGAMYLLPTVIHCPSYTHPAFGKEFLFPFLTVSESSRDDAPAALSGSLVVTAFTDDKELVRYLTMDPTIKKVYEGVETCAIDPTEPHDGYLTDFLYEAKTYRHNGTNGHNGADHRMEYTMLALRNFLRDMWSATRRVA